MSRTANTSAEGTYCGRAVHGVSNLSGEDLRQIEAHRAKDRPTPWAHLAARYAVNEIDLRRLFHPDSKPAAPEASKPARAWKWNDHNTGEMVRLYIAEDRTADETAAMLGISREAVIGKAVRMGLGKRARAA